MFFEAVYYSKWTITFGFLKQIHVIDYEFFETSQIVSISINEVMEKIFLDINISNYKEIDQRQRDKRKISTFFKIYYWKPTYAL